MTSAQQELKNYITSHFDGLVSDPKHWAESGIFTPEQLDRYLLTSSISDTFKDIYGVRPRFYDFDNMTMAELKAVDNDLAKEIEDGLKAEEEEKEAERMAQKKRAVDNAYRPNLAFSGLASMMQ